MDKVIEELECDLADLADWDTRLEVTRKIFPIINLAKQVNAFMTREEAIALSRVEPPIFNRNAIEDSKTKLVAWSLARFPIIENPTRESVVETLAREQELSELWNESMRDLTGENDCREQTVQARSIAIVAKENNQSLTVRECYDLAKVIGQKKVPVIGNNVREEIFQVIRFFLLGKSTKPAPIEIPSKQEEE